MSNKLSLWSDRKNWVHWFPVIQYISTLYESILLNKHYFLFTLDKPLWICPELGLECEQLVKKKKKTNKHKLPFRCVGAKSKLRSSRGDTKHQNNPLYSGHICSKITKHCHIISENRDILLNNVYRLSLRNGVDTYEQKLSIDVNM